MTRPPDPSISYVVAGLGAPERLDKHLRQHFPTWGRQAVNRIIGQRQVLVNGRPVWLASWEVRNGDRITVTAPPSDKPVPAVVFDDDWLIAVEPDLVAVSKPAGLLVEPVRQGDAQTSLRDLAIARFGPLTLFHRLDRDTSGVVLLTRSAELNRALAQAWQTRTVEKEYRAVVGAQGLLADTGIIDLRLAPHPTRRDKMSVVARGGQHALTRYAVLGQTAAGIVVQLWPETGRMHQLRVHLAALGAPILGDRLYGDPASAPRLMLHAYRLTLPANARAPLMSAMAVRTFLAPLPPGFNLT